MTRRALTSVAVQHDPAWTTAVDTAESAECAETGRLFEEYSGQLLAYCVRQLGSRSEAEDAVQTTFLYAFRALRRGVVPECEGAWLTTIARNVCHWQRRTAARRGPLASDVDLDTIGLAQPDGDEDGLLVGLKDALASIPENQRRAIVLREWQGVPPREIATELGMSATATHALLTRARRSLAEALMLPRRAALGVVWTLVELRSHIKALLAGVSTKAAVTTIAVVGVGAGAAGVAIDKTTGPDPLPASAQVVDEKRSVGTRPTRGERGETRIIPFPTVAESRPAGTQSSQRRPAPRTSTTTQPTAPAQVLEQDPERESVSPSDLQPASELQPQPEPPVALPSVPLPPALLPTDPLPLPELEVPTDLLPPIELPQLPAVEPPPAVDAPLLGSVDQPPLPPLETLLP